MHSASRQRIRPARDWPHAQTTLAPCSETGHCFYRPGRLIAAAD